MEKTRTISKHIQQTVLNGIKIPHSLSQPVIYAIDGKYYLAFFVFFYKREEIETGMIERPKLWVIADIETGELIKQFSCTDKDFSNSSYNIKYNVHADAKYDTSKAYYEKTFAILDSVREKIITSGKLYQLEYKIYLDRIIANVPKDYQTFYIDLSI